MQLRLPTFMRAYPNWRNALKDPFFWIRTMILLGWVGIPVYAVYSADWGHLSIKDAGDQVINSYITNMLIFVSTTVGFFSGLAGLIWAGFQVMKYRDRRFVQRVRSSGPYAVMPSAVAGKITETTTVAWIVPGRLVSLAGLQWLTWAAQRTARRFDDEITAWCADNILGGYTIHRQCQEGERYVSFDRVEDAFTFKMRWS